MKQLTLKFSGVWIILLAVFISAACAPLQAQVPSTFPLADPLVTITPKQAATFEVALQTVASQAHIGIVAEAAPLHGQLPLKTPFLLLPNSPVSAALSAVAAAYDYDVQRQGGVFVLQKHYSDPNDLPDVTPEECALALDDMAQVMAVLNPGPPEFGGGPHVAPLLVRIAATLTPAQLQEMEQQTADKGLSVASLSDEQQSWIRRFALTWYIYDPLVGVQNTLYQLHQTVTTTLSVEKRRQVATQTSRMGDGPPVTRTIVQDTAFGFNIRDFYDRPLFTQLDENAAFYAATSDQPSVLLPAPQGEPLSGGDGHTTIGAVIRGLNARGARVTMPPALLAKTLTVYGAGTADPEQLLKAVCTVYGLRCVKERDGRRRLTRPEISVPLTVAGLPDAVRRVLPLPLLRAMHDGELEKDNRQEERLLGKMMKMQADFIKMQQEQSRIDKRRQDMRFLPDTLHRIAVARLHAAFDAELSKPRITATAKPASQFTGHILLSSLPAAARSAFAVALTTGTLNEVIHILGRQAPVWAADVNACYLVGGLHPDPARPGVQIFSLMISPASSDGSLGMGITTSTDFP